MVYVTEDWAGFQAYAEFCRVGTYQVRPAVDGVEIRVRTGRLGFINTYTDTNDAEYKHIVKFCEVQGFVLVICTLQDEVFHI